MIKSNETTDPTSCLSKAADDEPLFVLRAQDILASPTIRFWIEQAILWGVNEAKIAEAEACAVMMDHWNRNPKLPD